MNDNSNIDELAIIEVANIIESSNCIFHELGKPFKGIQGICELIIHTKATNDYIGIHVGTYKSSEYPESDYTPYTSDLLNYNFPLLGILYNCDNRQLYWRDLSNDLMAPIKPGFLVVNVNSRSRLTTDVFKFEVIPYYLAKKAAINKLRTEINNNKFQYFWRFINSVYYLNPERVIPYILISSTFKNLLQVTKLPIAYEGPFYLDLIDSSRPEMMKAKHVSIDSPEFDRFFIGEEDSNVMIGSGSIIELEKEFKALKLSVLF